MKPLAFFALLVALVVLGCASVAREESRRVYDLGNTEASDEGKTWGEIQQKYGFTDAEMDTLWQTLDDSEAVDAR